MNIWRMIYFLCHYLEDNYGLFKQHTVYQGLKYVAAKNSFHPIREYFEKIKINKRNYSIDDWLVKYFSAPDTEYVRKAGKMWLISAVARIMEPGCQADYMLILEGEQSYGKSRAIRIMAGKWYKELINIRSQELKGNWIIDLSELDNLKKTEITTIKNYLIKTTYKYINQKHQCVFIGSTNKNNYLKDQTENRRFWCVKTGNINYDQLEIDRDKIWADAYLAYQNGEKWYIEPNDNFFELAKMEQEKRTEEDPRKKCVIDYIDKRKNNEENLTFISTYDILTSGLQISPGKQKYHDMKDVTRIMTELGYTKHRTNKLKGFKIEF